MSAAPAAIAMAAATTTVSTRDKVVVTTRAATAASHMVAQTALPTKLAFAMTIHKSQGQTYKRVGVALDRPVFVHGQLYVALSRCGYSPESKEGGARVAVREVPRAQGRMNQSLGVWTPNIVYREILTNRPQQSQ